MRVRIRRVRRQCSLEWYLQKMGEIIMALVLVQLIDIPTVAAALLKMRNTDDNLQKRARIAQYHRRSPCR